ncbi:MAG: cob(I)yrinic acid a,c-diamide adenosyltransferase [Bacteroidales bacterium]|nr:cob(I)yrinic acid a,c-diamide adenosyltransferase [Bacteroidales bacterium]MBN2758555.1 cob(I)yrinic acid a,c-diamide adenosyltransferase [Bacteroidales bacterium]
MKIYTKTGDSGKTSLLSGERVSKYNMRIEAYGTVDELNSFVGYLRSSEIKKEDVSFLIKIQNYLFNIGSFLAMSKVNPKIKIKQITDENIEELENEMDKIELNLPKLTNFILPGGNQAVSLSHICRSICRRTERLCVQLSENEIIDEKIIVFFNRLSDYFFVLSRKITVDYKIEEIVWKSEK